jgi:hypothetical protein
MKPPTTEHLEIITDQRPSVSAVAEELTLQFSFPVIEDDVTEIDTGYCVLVTPDKIALFNGDLEGFTIKDKPVVIHHRQMVEKGEIKEEKPPAPASKITSDIVFVLAKSNTELPDYATALSISLQVQKEDIIMSKGCSAYIRMYKSLWDSMDIKSKRIRGVKVELSLVSMYKVIMICILTHNERRERYI